MPKLLNRFELSKELEMLINEAKDFLILISPFFKLNAVLRTALEKHKNNTKFNLTIVYGKNEEDKMKSLCDEDMNFFKSFPEVEIRYHKRLHAKMYLNEEKCLITSLNLHDYSLKENIEVGILTKSKFFDTLNSLDMQAAKFADYIVEKSTIEFKKEIKREKYLFGLFSKTKGPEVIVEKSRTGYCIRTRQVIPLNPKHPYSTNAYKSWQVYKNNSYIEKYCHKCGKEFATSMARPLCLECLKST